jgi:hypothetical protein
VGGNSVPFRAAPLDPQRRRLALSGVVDESADLSFFGHLRGQVELNLRAVQRINSFGVRAWIQAVRNAPPDVSLQLTECPPHVIDQINMIADFTARAQVVSFLAPLYCPACDTEDTALFEAAACRQLGGRLPAATCPRCRGVLELLELEEQFLLFLRS